MPKRIVLAYSGGLDTSVLVRWMTEEMGAEVIALAVDLGQGGDWEAIKARAVAAGAAEWRWPTPKRSSHQGLWPQPSVPTRCTKESTH